MYRRTEYECVFFTGGILYTLIEMLWRGYSHWSMTIAGGVCMVLVHFVSDAVGRQRGMKAFILKCLISTIAITAVELAFGVIFNLVLKMDIWDYSDKPGNILGQICPAYCGAWLMLSAAALKLSDGVRAVFKAIKKREIVEAI